MTSHASRYGPAGEPMCLDDLL